MPDHKTVTFDASQYQLVPIDPTVEMIIAIAEADQPPSSRYSNMLAAAPTPAAQSAGHSGDVTEKVSNHVADVRNMVAAQSAGQEAVAEVRDNPDDIGTIIETLGERPLPVGTKLYAAPVPVDASEPVAAWLHEDGERVITAQQKAGMERDGGAGKSSVSGYLIPLRKFAVPVNSGDPMICDHLFAPHSASDNELALGKCTRCGAFVTGGAPVNGGERAIVDAAIAWADAKPDSMKACAALVNAVTAHRDERAADAPQAGRASEEIVYLYQPIAGGDWHECHRQATGATAFVRAALTSPAKGNVGLHPAIREGVEAAFEQRDGWMTKIAAAVRHLPAEAAKVGGDEREAFERWCWNDTPASANFYTERNALGDYTAIQTDGAWQGWQARAALSANGGEAKVTRSRVLPGEQLMTFPLPEGGKVTLTWPEGISSASIATLSEMLVASALHYMAAEDTVIGPMPVKANQAKGDAL